VTTLNAIKALISALSIQERRELNDWINSHELTEPPLKAVTANIEDPIHRIPLDGIHILFCESSAGSFAGALRTAQLAKSTGTFLENKKIWHYAIFEKSAMPEAAKLAQALASLRNKRCLIDGLECDWQETFAFAYCAAEKSKSYRPSQYCFGHDRQTVNPWGCVNSRLDWTEWSALFKHGTFSQSKFLGRTSTKWVFDKRRIKHEVATNLFRYRFCPFIDTGLIDRVLLAFPDEIDMDRSTQWTYSESYNETSSKIQITQKHNSSGYFSEQRYADGVKPTSIDTLRDILSKAASGDPKLLDVVAHFPKT
jgi:hypothetical protein